jgi:pimeloyl-ACP methyl ester carboxylesterase
MAGDPEYAVENNPTDDNHDDSLKSQTTHRNKNKHKQSHASPIMDWFLGWCLPYCMRFVPFVQVTNGLKNDYYLERQKWPFRTEEIVQPAVVVLGDQDSILPNEVAVKVHERLPNSKLKMLRGVGHNELLQDDILDMVFRTVVDLAKSSPHGNALSDKDMGTQLLCSSTSG